MKSLNYRRSVNLKSRFTGFFAFLLLVACQPADDSQSGLMARASSDPGAAMQLASQRLASGEYDAALRWFRHGARLGNTAALSHAIQLQQRQQGRLATAQWLQQQFAQGYTAPEAVAQSQLNQLGLWSAGDAGVAGYHHPQGCQLTLQPVVSQQAGIERWQQLLQQWQADSQLSQLPVCFLALQRLPSIDLACSEHNNTLLRCNYQPLAAQVSSGSFSQLLVIAGRGKASYNNGIIQLPDNASLALFRHEFMHVLGFVDEYALSDVAAAEVCQPGRVYPNMLLGGDTEVYQQHWRLPAVPELTAVPTCAALGAQAYRVIAEDNLMQFYELGLPSAYLLLAQQILQQPEQIMPVQYYFAYLARQQQNWPLWRHLMQQAADWGYSDASAALAP